MGNIKMDLLENRNLRDKIINEERLDVLDSVKEIATLGNSEYCTTQQVADYYEVGVETIKKIYQRHREELESNGLKTLKNEKLKEFKGKVQDVPTLEKIKFVSKLVLFSKRTVLNVGMLLTESKVAEEVRKMLLDNHEQLTKVHNDLLEGKEIEIDKTSPTYFIDKEKELRESEKLLYDEMTEALMSGDTSKVAIVSSKVNNIKENIILLQKERADMNKDKADGFDTFMDTTNVLSWQVVADNLGIGRNTLTKLLREKHILQEDKYTYNGKTYTGEHHNVPYSKYIQNNYFEVKFTTQTNGKRKATTKVTAKGQDYLRKKLIKWGKIA